LLGREARHTLRRVPQPGPAGAAGGLTRPRA